MNPMMSPAVPHLMGLPISGPAQSVAKAPTAKPSKPTRRGRGRGKGAKSGKPGVVHHTAMNQAYASGNYAVAKTHALNLVNALHKHMSGGSPSAMAEPDADEQGGPPDMDADDAAPASVSSTTTMGVMHDPPGPDSDHWISGAIQHPGALHRALGVPQGQKIPAAKIAKAAHSDNPTLARRARLAQTLKGMRR